MIQFIQGDCLAQNTDIIVNTVNCVGVMGKGLALSVKQNHEWAYNHYRKVCDAKKLRPGMILVSRLESKPTIFHCAVKDDWRNDSNFEWVASCLFKLRVYLEAHPDVSVSMPVMGSGNGKLPYDDCVMLITSALSELPNHIVVCTL